MGLPVDTAPTPHSHGCLVQAALPGCTPSAPGDPAVPAFCSGPASGRGPFSGDKPQCFLEGTCSLGTPGEGGAQTRGREATPRPPYPFPDPRTGLRTPSGPGTPGAAGHHRQRPEPLGRGILGQVSRHEPGRRAGALRGLRLGGKCSHTTVSQDCGPRVEGQWTCLCDVPPLRQQSPRPSQCIPEVLPWWPREVAAVSVLPGARCQQGRRQRGSSSQQSGSCSPARTCPGPCGQCDELGALLTVPRAAGEGASWWPGVGLGAPSVIPDAEALGAAG